MRSLAGAGIIFAEDYKQAWSPADLMRELHSTGRLCESFSTIAWRGPGDWFVSRQEGQAANES